MALKPLYPSRALIFAAGLGTRMRPLTLTNPKPLIDVAGVKLIDYMLDAFAAAGLQKAIVNVHYLADHIEAHLRHRSAPAIIISDERDRLLDQGGGIKKALAHIDEEALFICNTDAFWVDAPFDNIRHLAQHWNPALMDALLLLAPTLGSIGVEGQGDFDRDEQGRLSRRRADGTAAFVYTGVGIIKADLCRFDERQKFPLAPLLFALAEQKKLYGQCLGGRWMHVGTPEAIGQAEQALAMMRG
jgi:MurNAc alpha-1-phosphate uridylyltransferase